MTAKCPGAWVGVIASAGDAAGQAAGASHSITRADLRPRALVRSARASLSPRRPAPAPVSCDDGIWTERRGVPDSWWGDWLRLVGRTSWRSGGVLLAVGILLVAPAGCRRAAAPANVAAMVGEAVITVDRLQAEVDRRARATGGRPDVQKVLQELIDQEATYQKAERSGFLARPETQQAIRTLVVGRYIQAREQEVQITNAITPELLRGYYDLNRARFMRPPAVNAAAIRLDWRRHATDQKKAEALEAARALRQKAIAEASAQASFGKLATEHSTDQATRYRGGEMGWMTREQAKLRLPEAAVAALFGLSKAGEVSEPVVTELGIYLLKLIGARGEELRPFDEVRPQIEHELARQRQAEREARLRQMVRAGLAIRVNEEQVARVVPPAPVPVPVKPPRLPRG